MQIARVGRAVLAALTGSLVLAASAHATPSAEWPLFGNLTDRLAPHTVLSEPARDDASGPPAWTVDDVDGMTRKVLSLPLHTGLAIPSPLDYSHELSYSVTLTFKLADVSGTHQLIDVSPGGGDGGLVLVDGNVRPTDPGCDSLPVSADEWHALTLNIVDLGDDFFVPEMTLDDADTWCYTDLTPFTLTTAPIDVFMGATEDTDTTGQVARLMVTRNRLPYDTPSTVARTTSRIWPSAKKGKAGSALSLTLTGFVPFYADDANASTVHLTYKDHAGTVTDLGDLTPDDDGTISGVDVSIPADAAPGAGQFRATSAFNQLRASVGYTVVPVP